MENERPAQQALVKCVVVGDNAVGKTRLIVARACNAKISREQLMATHIPTVWAIDQYRLYPEIQERARDNVDGAEASLRLWDTFGDHHKDRRFAYGRCDVVLLCFSIAKPPSLKHIKSVWFPEIRRFCPHTPIIMCGCQNDLRFANLDELNKYRGLLTKPIYEKDIIPPQDCRQVAKDIGAPYYESSVITLYGIREVFDNVIRAALISRRHTRFWMSSLRKVQKPLLQEPYLPPKPDPPNIHIPSSTFIEDIGSLLDNPMCSDVMFVIRGILIPAHRVCLVAASPTFYDIFLTDLSDKIGSSTSEVPDLNQSAACKDGETPQVDKEEVIEREDFDVEVFVTTAGTSSWETPSATVTADLKLPLGGTVRKKPTSEAVRTPSSSEDSVEALGACAPRTRLPSDQISGCMEKYFNNHSTTEFHGFPGKTLDSPIFASIHLQPVEDPISGAPNVQTVVTVKPHISPAVFQVCLEYLYMGVFDHEKWGTVDLEEVINVAENLQLEDLVTIVSNVHNQEAYMNTMMVSQFHRRRVAGLRDYFLRKGLFSDMVIQTDDGMVAAHKALLMARCDMMHAMLGGNFRESTYTEIYMPGTKGCFQVLLEYLYTDECPPIKPAECLHLIELANFLCLPHLLAQAEENIIKEFQLALEKERDVQEDVINLLKVTKMHNANQLHQWCLTFVASNFIDIHQKYARHLHSINSGEAHYLQRHQWPPLWYLKEKDYYDKAKLERDKSERTTTRKGKRKWCL
ncbi:rho-related BTB domain-containing protein 1-like [Glandiceps talaboti]